MHIFELIEWGGIIEISDMDATKTAVGSGDGAVKEYLDYSDSGTG